MKAELLIRSIENDKRWFALLSETKYSSYLAGIPFEYSLNSKSRHSSSFIFTKEGKDIAGAHYTLKRSYWGLITLADISSGILFKAVPDADIFRFVLHHFLDWAKAQGLSYARILPGLPLNIASKVSDFGPAFLNVLKDAGFSQINKERYTYWIDLNKSEEELLKSMNAQTRKKIRLAENSNISIEFYEQFSNEIVESFFKLYDKLGDRKNFDTLSKDRFFNEVRALFESGAVLYVLKYQGITIDMALATSTGIASYYHGALNPDYKNLEGCPSPGHFIQWLLIKHMKQKGLKTYDMAFCPGPVPEKEHPRFDMWRFKYGFGGDSVAFFPTFGKSLQPIRGKFFQLLRYKK